MNSYQKDILDFLSDYSATGIEITHGGKHPKVEFDFRGKHVAYTIAASPSDHRASANTISELKRLLGEPEPETAKERRHLSDMLPGTPPRETFAGKVALYQSGRNSLMFRFFLPKTLIDAAGISPGQQFVIFALDQFTWHFHLISDNDGQPHPRLTQEKTNKAFFVVRATAFGLTKLGPFGVSPAEYSIVGDGIVVHLPAETIVQTGTNRSAGPRLKAVQPAAAPAVVPVVPADTDDAPVAERLRALLALIQGAERQTGYRLLKVRRDDKTDGVWTWRAPEIRLED